MTINRRELCALLPLAIFPGGLSLQESATQDTSLPSATFPFDKMTVQKSEHSEARHILKGKLATGESLEVHETTLLPGAAPHPPHHHRHSEMWLIREGTMELNLNGKTYQLGPGSVGFVHSDEEHGIKNIGSTPATYFVVAMGPGAA